MTRKSTPKKKKPAPPMKVYIAVREMVSANKSYTEPDRVFASRAAARKHADQLNRELRAFTNPFGEDQYPGDFVKSGDDDDFFAVLTKLGVSVPKPSKGQSYVNWAEWWDRTYPDLTDAQRDAMWDALDEFEWYKVKQTTLEG